MSRVVPLGLIAVVTACPTVKIGSNDKPGFKAWNDDPGAADGVICTPVGMKVPFLKSSSSAFAEITAPILITLEIASARADTRTHGWQVRPVPNMCYLLFAAQFSESRLSGPSQQLFSERLPEISELRRALFQRLLWEMNNPQIFLSAYDTKAIKA